MFTQLLALSYPHPPTVVVGDPDPNWDNVVLLCPFDNNFNDVKSGLVPSATNLVNLVTSAKFNGGLKMASIASSVKFAASTNYSFGTTPFTIDGWVSIPVASPTNTYLFDIGGNGLVIHYLNGAWNIYGNGGGLNANSAAYTLTPGELMYFELSRSGTTINLFINGVNVITRTIGSTVTFGSNSVLTIGNYGGSNYSNNGMIIDDFRITKGIRRNATNYTPPVLPAGTSSS